MKKGRKSKAETEPSLKKQRIENKDEIITKCELQWKQKMEKRDEIIRKQEV